MNGEPPDAVIVFVSAAHDYKELLGAINEGCRPKHLVGSSSAGEFTNRSRGEGSACALALRSDQIRFAASLGRDISSDRAAAAAQLVGGFQGLRDHSYPYRSALI